MIEYRTSALTGKCWYSRLGYVTKVSNNYYVIILGLVVSWLDWLNLTLIIIVGVNWRTWQDTAMLQRHDWEIFLEKVLFEGQHCNCSLIFCSRSRIYIECWITKIIWFYEEEYIQYQSCLEEIHITSIFMMFSWWFKIVKVLLMLFCCKENMNMLMMVIVIKFRPRLGQVCWHSSSNLTAMTQLHFACSWEYFLNLPVQSVSVLLGGVGLPLF